VPALGHFRGQAEIVVPADEFESPAQFNERETLAEKTFAGTRPSMIISFP
jgi:hypothetical protein